MDQRKIEELEEKVTRYEEALKKIAARKPVKHASGNENYYMVMLMAAEAVEALK